MRKCLAWRHRRVILITSRSPFRLLASLQWVYFSQLSMFSPANMEIQFRLKVYCTLECSYFGLAVDQDFTLNILALPDVFLRKVMRTLDFKDRLNLRLTCRSVFANFFYIFCNLKMFFSAFEQLVANSHAGYFGHGKICRFYNDIVRVTFALESGRIPDF